MKIKNFIAVAALLMGSTSTFATAITHTQEYTYEGLVYVLDYSDNDTPTNPADDKVEAKVKQISDDATYKALTTWLIPEKFKALADNGADPKIADKFFIVQKIGVNAFANNSNITSITFAKAENITEIATGAFSKTSIATLDLSETKITVADQWFETTNTTVTTIKLPKTVNEIVTSAFEGLSALNSLTIAEETAPAKHAITIAADAFKNTMALKTLTLPAEVSFVAANAFRQTYLEELTIGGDVPAVTTTAGVQTGAFVRNGSQELIVNYAPTGAGNTASFAQSAFATDKTGGADVWVTFKTTTAYGNAFAGSTLTKDDKGNYLYGAKLDFTPTAKDKIKVYNQGGSYSYGTFLVPATGITIAKKQGDANVMVYGAYVDNAETPAILMEQLHLIKGSYYIPSAAAPNQTKIIVKTSGTADVEYTTGVNLGGVAQDSRNFDGATTPKSRNEIKAYSGDDTYAVNVKPSATTKYVIFLKPLDETTFGWAEFTDTRIVKDGQFYLEADVPASAMRLIWLDGSEEEATAIKSVKKANAENGAIYNLAGQKVNAAYKGVVIKDGKKYIQK